MPSDTKLESPNERRARTRKEIVNLIEDRNSVLSQYYNLAKHSDDTNLNKSDTLDLLEEFCQKLVDYIAAGHFEIYRRIEEGNERRDEITNLAAKIMPRINGTTQIAIAFNDIYDTTQKISGDAITQLPKYLAKLGEELATRIDLEDQFINTLLSEVEKPKLAAVCA